MKVIKVFLIAFFLLSLVGMSLAGRRLIYFDYERSLTPRALNNNFRILSDDIEQIREQYQTRRSLENEIQSLRKEINRLRDSQRKVRYYIDYLYKTAASEGPPNNAEEWWKRIILERENALRDMEILPLK